ncbi:hypothetical protein JCM3770_005344 [Rhodotorula araucariae]
MATQLQSAAELARGLPALAGTLQALESSKSSAFDEKVVDVESLEDLNVLYGHVIKDGVRVPISWTKDEERRVVRKADMFLLPIFTILFFWMALDRTNVSGVLTTTFLKDTGITRDEANTGTSLLWLGIVLLEIPSNIILQRVGAHVWIPVQVVLWGLAEVLTMFVKNASGWYAARIFLGLLESGFIPGALYTLSRWYTRAELAKRTTIFFFGPSISAAFGSLIAAGCIRIHGHLGLLGWQWIFVICGASTITAGVLALVLLPKSPRHTAGGIRGKGWFTEREADVFLARIQTDDPLKEAEAATMHIGFKDVLSVLADWRIWPHLIMCLSGLQSVGGLGVWGATIIKSLGFTAINANLLSVPGPLLTCVTGPLLAWVVDHYAVYGLSITFVAVWTLAGLIALYSLPIVAGTASWGFYAALVVTLASPSWQPLNVTWLSLSMRTPQRRAIAYAVYIGCSNLGGTYGNQVFRGNDAPKYRKAWAACLSLGAVWLAFTLAQTAQYWWTNKQKERKWAALSEEEKERYLATTTEDTGRRLDFRYPV